MDGPRTLALSYREPPDNDPEEHLEPQEAVSTLLQQ
jgi:hypothetical protein